MEIERKFLVKDDTFKREARGSTRITQGYLSSVPERSVRVRVKGGRGFITIKGLGNGTGASRYEWEKRRLVGEAKELLQLCEPGIIDKTRYLVDAGEHTFEVDVFHGANEGLIIAEIELDDEDAPFERPEWLGQEVTGDQRYYNAMLSRNPYQCWNKE